MAHSSLRTRILVMTALPAFLAALVIGGYTLVHRMVEVRADTAHRQQHVCAQLQLAPVIGWVDKQQQRAEGRQRARRCGARRRRRVAKAARQRRVHVIGGEEQLLGDAVARCSRAHSLALTADGAACVSRA